MASSPGIFFNLICLIIITIIFFGGPPCGATVKNKKFPKSAMEALLRPSTYGGDITQVMFYSDNPEWSDLLAVANSHDQFDVDVICVHGAWVLYRNTHYVTRTSFDYAIISGSQLCTRWANTKSMQPLGVLDDAFSPSVTFFTEPHLGSIGHTVNSRRGRKYFEYLRGTVKSLVVVGMSQWTVTDVNGTEYCLATNFDRAEFFPACKVDDMTLSPIGAPWNIESITKGCPADVTKDRLVHLRDCEYFGRASTNAPGPNEVPEIPGDGPDVPSRGTDAVGFREPAGPGFDMEGSKDGLLLWHWNWNHGGGIDNNDPNGYNVVPEPYNYLNTPGPPDEGPTTEYPTDVTANPRDKNNTNDKNPFENMKTCPNKLVDEYAYLLAVRLNHDYLSEEQLLWPAKREDIWRAELLDAAFQISFMLVPETSVPKKYLLMIREFMMYKLTQNWKKAKGPAEPNHQEQALLADLALCTERLASSPPVFTQLNDDIMMDKLPKEIFSEFHHQPGLDIVIDATYLLINLVMGACHHIFDYTTNFWVHYVHVFMRLFLTPMVEEWAHNSLIEVSLLGGYDVVSQHARLAIITTTMLEMTASFEPFDRPERVYELLEKNSKKPK